jgi:sodium/potassium/calcium exchanger 2
MFLALAIICDEFFVPALEVIADEMELSKDIAGATLMAAGGSAPELFTSLVGTFEESEVGFSTIVGSAVFNVIFVIGVCALAAPRPLELTSWPLFRDSTYYVISLLMLSTFFTFTSAEEIYFWEALILFIMYLGYVLIMAINVRLHRWALRVIFKMNKEDIDEKIRLQDPEQRLDLIESIGFRAGILDILMKDKSLVDKAAVAVVAQISGSASETFDTIDKDSSGTIDKGELAQLLKKTTLKNPSPEEIKEVMSQIAPSNEGSISKDEFLVWYATSEDALKKQVEMAFKEFDTNGDGFVLCNRIPEVLGKLNHKVGSKELNGILKELDKDQDGQLSFEEFGEWYRTSVLWERLRRRSMVAAQAGARSASDASDAGEKDVGGDDDDEDPLKFPSDAGFLVKVYWLLSAPLLLVFIYCIPDPQKKGMAWVAFFMSIAWIGVFSYYMVIWAEIIGATLSIPTVVMGLVFLAAGTLLSSA